MNILLEIAGIAACCSVAVRYTHNWAKQYSGFAQLFTEGRRVVQNQVDGIIQNCVNWNIRQRDTRRAETLNPRLPVGVRRAAERDVRRFQRNIDRLNEQLRQSDSLTDRVH
jgi:hypothetical protein